MLAGEGNGHSDPTPAAGETSPVVAAGRRPFDIPDWLDRAAAWSWRLLLIGAAVVVLALAFSRLRIVLVPAIVALLIAALLAPVAKKLRSWGWPGLLATWTTLLGTLIVVGGAIAGAAALIATQLSGDTERWERVGDDLRSWLRDDAPFNLDDNQIDELWERFRDAAAGGLQGVGSDTVRLVAEILSGVFLGVVLVFFFVHDGAGMWKWVVRHVSRQRTGAFDDAGRRAITTLGAYVRGLAITGLVDGLIIGIGLVIIGVPLAIPLAVITFFGAFIPIVGAVAAGALAVVVALVTEGPTSAILAAFLVLVVQQVEGDLVMPLVMRRQVRLHPAVILVAVTTGGALLGVIGAFLAVPIAAVLVEIVSAFRAAETRHTLVGEDSAPDELILPD